MSEITELEQRLAAALERISAGAEALSAQVEYAAFTQTETTPGDSEDVAKLEQALEDEKTANAQLEARVASIHAKLEGQMAEMQDQIVRLRDQAQAADADQARLRGVNDELRRLNTELRTANAEGVGNPDLINAAMLAELESLRALRESERAEVEEIIAELTPMVQEENHA